MEIMECNRIGHHRHSFVHGKRKMNVLLLFASRDILKYDRFFNFCGKKDRKRFSHGAQVKKPTLPKKVKINKETDNIVSRTNINLVTTTTLHFSINFDFLNTYVNVSQAIQKKMKLSYNVLKCTTTLTPFLNF